jgi:hypothetical protein
MSDCFDRTGQRKFEHAYRKFLNIKLTRIIREGDEGTRSREFFEGKQGKKEAEKGRKGLKVVFSGKNLPAWCFRADFWAHLSPGKQRNGWEK